MTRRGLRADIPTASAGYDRAPVALIASRPYVRDDFTRLTELLLAGREAGTVELYPSVSELRLLLADADAVQARVWREERDGLVAFGLFDPTWRTLTFFAAPEIALGDVVPSVLAWAEEAARAHPPTDGKPAARVRPRDTDRELVGLLEERGFVREGWQTLRFGRDLREPIPTPRLPPGYAIRHLGGEHELAAYTAMHREAFGTAYMTVARRLPLLRDPGYDPELDLVAVAPDGQFAAFVYCSVDEEENRRLSVKQGWTDPIGTRPAHRRRGLATALVLEGFRRLRDRGVDRAYLGTGDDNIALQGVCAATGYRLEHAVLAYAKAS
jgi:GNAT superfamily N-acetyltransferase